MVLIDFEFDEKTVARDRSSAQAFGGLEKMPTRVLADYHFVMPIRFQVGEAQMLAQPVKQGQHVWVYDPLAHTIAISTQSVPAAPWMPMPLLQALIDTLYVIKETEDQNAASCRVPIFNPNEVSEVLGLLHFDLASKMVSVRSGLTGQTGTATHDELRSAFGSFAARVRQVLAREVPELLYHFEWGPWIRGVGEAPYWSPSAELYENLDLD